MILIKVDEGYFYPGHRIPIVYVKLTKSAEVPKSVDEIDKLPFVHASHCPLEMSVLPLDIKDPRSDLQRKMSIEYKNNACGTLTEYRFCIFTRSKKEIPDDILYLGRFPAFSKPEDEFIPWEKLNFYTVPWCWNDEISLETDVLYRYACLNLGEEGKKRILICLISYDD